MDRNDIEASLENKWLKEDKDPIVPKFTGKYGIQVELPENATELDAFKCYVTDEFYGIIAEQTNTYAAQYLTANPTLGIHSLVKTWKDVTGWWHENDFLRYVC